MHQEIPDSDNASDKDHFTKTFLCACIIAINVVSVMTMFIALQVMGATGHSVVNPIILRIFLLVLVIFGIIASGFLIKECSRFGNNKDEKKSTKGDTRKTLFKWLISVLNSVWFKQILVLSAIGLGVMLTCILDVIIILRCKSDMSQVIPEAELNCVIAYNISRVIFVFTQWFFVVFKSNNIQRSRLKNIAFVLILTVDASVWIYYLALDSSDGMDSFRMYNITDMENLPTPNSTAILRCLEGSTAAQIARRIDHVAWPTNTEFPLLILLTVFEIWDTSSNDSSGIPSLQNQKDNEEVHGQSFNNDTESVDNNRTECVDSDTCPNTKILNASSSRDTLSTHLSNGHTSKEAVETARSSTPSFETLNENRKLSVCYDTFKNRETLTNSPNDNSTLSRSQLSHCQNVSDPAETQTLLGGISSYSSSEKWVCFKNHLLLNTVCFLATATQIVMHAILVANDMNYEFYLALVIYMVVYKTFMCSTVITCFVLMSYHMEWVAGKSKLEINDVVFFVCTFGSAVYFISIITAGIIEKTDIGYLEVAECVVNMVSVSTQTVLLTMAMRCVPKRDSYNTRKTDKWNCLNELQFFCQFPSLCAVLAWMNIGFWAVDSFIGMKYTSVAGPKEHLFGKEYWDSILQFVYPLVIFYRLESAFHFWSLKDKFHEITEKID